MIESLHFSYDNIFSEDMGVLNVHIDNGLFDEFFLPTRTINEQKAFGREKPYFIDVTDEPISFSMTIYFNEKIQEGQLKKVARWLYQDYYKPLIFSSHPNRIFYAMLEGDSRFIHNGAGEGYLTINVRCDSPYAYSPEYFEQNVLLKTETNGNLFTIDQSNFEDNDLDKLEVVDGVLKIKRIYKWGDYPTNSKWGDIV